MAKEKAPAPAPGFTADAPYGWFFCPWSAWKHAEVELGPAGARVERSVLIARPIRRGKKQFFMFCACTGRLYMPVDWLPTQGYTEAQALEAGARLVY